jgi:hypothetical protein
LIGQTAAGAVLLALLGSIPILGGLVGFVATALGLGALILTRAGTQRYPLPYAAPPAGLAPSASSMTWTEPMPPASDFAASMIPATPPAADAPATSPDPDASATPAAPPTPPNADAPPTPSTPPDTDAPAAPPSADAPKAE